MEDREGHGLGYTVPQLTQALYTVTWRLRDVERLLARAYPFLTWRDEVRGVDPGLDAEFDAIVRDVEVAIQHVPEGDDDVR